MWRQLLPPKLLPAIQKVNSILNIMQNPIILLLPSAPQIRILHQILQIYFIRRQLPQQPAALRCSRPAMTPAAALLTLFRRGSPAFVASCNVRIIISLQLVHLRRYTVLGQLY